MYDQTYQKSINSEDENIKQLMKNLTDKYVMTTFNDEQNKQYKLIYQQQGGSQKIHLHSQSINLKPKHDSFLLGSANSSNIKKNIIISQYKELSHPSEDSQNKLFNHHKCKFKQTGDEDYSGQNCTCFMINQYCDENKCHQQCILLKHNYISSLKQKQHSCKCNMNQCSMSQYCVCLRKGQKCRQGICNCLRRACKNDQFYIPELQSFIKPREIISKSNISVQQQPKTQFQIQPINFGLIQTTNSYKSDYNYKMDQEFN